MDDLKVGDSVFYTKEIGGLDFGEIGVIKSLHDAIPRNKATWASVHYPQNLKKSKVCYHSAYLTELIKEED